MKTACSLLWVVCLLTFGVSRLAAVPPLINYQGKLSSASGGLVNGTVEMVFSIYSDPSGGGPLWAESQVAVVVENGVFNVLLGTITPIPDAVFNGDVRYLGLKIDSDPEMTPRRPMVSVAYAIRAGAVDGGGGGGWVDDGTVVRLTTGTDSVGIGTADPQANLDIAGNSLKLGAYLATVHSEDIDGDGYAGSYVLGPLGIEGNAHVSIGYGDPDQNASVSGTTKFYVNGDAKFNGVISGGMALSQTLFSASTGNNNDILNGVTASFVRIIGPTAPFTITGMAGGQAGRTIVLYNTTGQNMTIANESTSSSTYDRIITLSGADETTVGAGCATLVYDGSNRWILTALKP